MKHALTIIAVILAILAGVIAFASGDLLAGAFFSIMWAFALGFIEPRRAWLRFVKPTLEWIGGVFAALLVVYAALAIAAPLQPYGINEKYCWDEFCFHTTSVKRAKSIGEGAQQVNARGTFYIVEAQMEAPWWGRFWWSPDAVYVVTRDDRRIEHSPQGQRAIDALTGRSSACHEILGAAETETIVFDLPDDAVQPRLVVRDTLGFEGFIGAMRLGHEPINPAFNLRYD